ncbi:MAG: hypothetical protein C0392_00745 [Syntrophus sp. (in: bacteria)]|nr:hypothetical protein [Syntrophus sp. (in: bacteria)]
MKKPDKTALNHAGFSAWAEQADLKKELEKRVRESDCLYAISRLFKEKDMTLDEILQKTVDAIPRAFPDSDKSSARIILEDRLFKTINFHELLRKQKCDIIVYGVPVGVLEVFDSEKPFPHNEGSFPDRAMSLIAAIAEHVERTIEQKQTEKALQESEERFRCLVENSPTGIFIIRNGKVIYENPEEKRLSGPLALLFREGNLRNIHPDDIQKVKDGYEKIISGEIETLDQDFRYYPREKEDGDPDMKWVLCRASSIEYSGEKAVLVNKLDVTRAKELEHLLGIEDKMASLGRVASGMAHEIRNPLSGINIYLSNLEKIIDRGQETARGKAILGHIQSASNKIESIIRRVMDFSKPSEPKLVMTDINQVIGEALELLSVILRKTGIILEKVLAANLPQCYMDPQLIGRVILNLTSNAAEAMKNIEGTKRIEITSFIKDNHIVVSVSDSGPGVPAHLRRKVFDPFYTTKKGNTGIGLSLSHRIISDHGGSLGVSASRWGGAAFIVEIPLQRRYEHQ